MKSCKMEAEIRREFLKLSEEHTKILNGISKKYLGEELLDLDEEDLIEFMKIANRIWNEELNKVLEEIESGD